MRGYATKEKWAVFSTYGGHYEAERIIDGKREVRYVRAHCLACAKTEVLTRYGGRVDLRGLSWAKPTCAAFVRVVQDQILEEEEER